MKVNKIINGDCIEELKKIDENSIDLIFADPPYWMQTNNVLYRVDGTEFQGVNDEWDKFNDSNEYEDFTTKWLKECYRVLKKDGSIWVIGGMQCIYRIGSIMQNIGYWIINDVVWQKSNPTPNFKGTRLNNSHETLIWATKNKNSKYTFNYKTAKELNIDVINYDKGIRKQLGSIWKFPVSTGSERLKDKNGNKLHSTQKPEKLLYQIINISSKIGDIVLDPFGGTMTTGKIAKQTGRNYLMIERDTKYCEYGKQRLDLCKVEIGDIEKAIFDKKPIRVTLSEMINDNFLVDGEQLYLKSKNHEKVILNSKGKIVLNDGTETDIHHGAALIAKRKSDRVNGFDYWYVIRNKKLVSISSIRDEYRKYISKE